MKCFFSALSALLTGVLLSSCAVTSVPEAAQEAALKTVAGEWVFSHTGKPTVYANGMPDVNALFDSYMKDVRLSIRPDGRMISLAMGAASESTVKVVQSNELAIELRGGKPVASIFYDRKTGLLSTAPGKIEMSKDGSEQKGTVPVYYKRAP